MKSRNKTLLVPIVQALLIIMLQCFAIVSFGQKSGYVKVGTYQHPFQNPMLSLEARVADLVSLLTLEEKVGQILNAAPAIERFDIPAYEWWNEVLHGVARTPYKVTVYPQAIAMAATFDTTALKLMADYSAAEGSAVYKKVIAQGKRDNRFVGLTYWTPNINIFCDPRWGRGQETYGEDPFLTAMLGTAFVRGLQGNDGKYWKAAACAKHYAVHSDVSGKNKLAPIRSLKDFQRVFLKAGESKEVKFTLTPEDISLIDDNGIAQHFTGKVTITVGRAQPDAKTLVLKKLCKVSFMCSNNKMLNS